MPSCCGASGSCSAGTDAIGSPQEPCGPGISSTSSSSSRPSGWSRKWKAGRGAPWSTAQPSPGTPGDGMPGTVKPGWPCGGMTPAPGGIVPGMPPTGAAWFGITPPSVATPCRGATPATPSGPPSGSGPACGCSGSPSPGTWPPSVIVKAPSRPLPRPWRRDHRSQRPSARAGPGRPAPQPHAAAAPWRCGPSPSGALRHPGPAYHPRGTARRLKQRQPGATGTTAPDPTAFSRSGTRPVELPTLRAESGCTASKR